MTSPGLKRTLDFEMPPTNTCGPSGINLNKPVANGSKRRCTNYASQSRTDHPGGGHCNSPFRDPSSFLAPLSEDIAAMIKDELNRVNEDQCNGSEPALLTVRQTHSICEKLIKDREQKLREEYDRILACKLVEQYGLLSQPNYHPNSYGHTMGIHEPKMPTTLRPQAGDSPMNALAVAFTSMQRSAPSVANSRTTIADLNAFAASLNGGTGHTSTLATSQLAYHLQHRADAAAMQAQQQRVSLNSCTIPWGPVLLTSNLDEQLAVPEALFTLFGVFGDVIRVKILFNKKDNALIQMADANQAQVAQGYLDKQRIFGKNIRVTRSKHQLVQMPREGNQSDAGLTKDFTNSPLHRFKIPGSRNYSNIYPPSNTLHISNIPSTIEEDEIRKAFTKACGFDYLYFKFFPKDRKMALMRFESLEQATIALIKMHNFQISEDNNLRVSFSKSVMQQ